MFEDGGRGGECALAEQSPEQVQHHERQLERAGHRSPMPMNDIYDLAHQTEDTTGHGGGGHNARRISASTTLRGESKDCNAAAKEESGARIKCYEIEDLVSEHHDISGAA